MINIDLFLKELRDSSDYMMTIFTTGSCFRLYKILQTIYPNAIPYWSDRDRHCITEISGRFYDIGGEICVSHVEDRGYFKILPKMENGYYLLKHTSNKDNQYSVTVEKYI
jgi:hypothetical protein